MWHILVNEDRNYITFEKKVEGIKTKNNSIKINEQKENF